MLNTQDVPANLQCLKWPSSPENMASLAWAALLPPLLPPSCHQSSVPPKSQRLAISSKLTNSRLQGDVMPQFQFHASQPPLAHGNPKRVLSEQALCLNETIRSEGCPLSGMYVAFRELNISQVKANHSLTKLRCHTVATSKVGCVALTGLRIILVIRTFCSTFHNVQLFTPYKFQIVHHTFLF